jgi:hypothetical protein
MLGKELPGVVEGHAREKDLPSDRQRHEASGEIGGQPNDVALAGDFHHRDLANMQAQPGGELQLAPGLRPHAVLKQEREAHGIGDRGERREIAIPGIFHDLHAGELPPGFLENRVVALDGVGVRAHAETALQIRGVHHIGEGENGELRPSVGWDVGRSTAGASGHTHGVRDERCRNCMGAQD